MTISSELSEKIKSRIDEYIVDSSNLEYQRSLASKFGVLPLFFDWEYFLAIRSDGEIINVPTEDAAKQPYIENDIHLRKLALVEGSIKYPELKILLPPKPDDAIVCPYCEGRGDMGHKNPALKKVICLCSGLGWVPKGYEREGYN